MSIKGFLAKKDINIALDSIKEGEVLFHSSTSEFNDDILENGIVPQKGAWLQEVLSGSVDDPEHYDELLNDGNDISFYSKAPSWVSAKVSKKLNKSIGEITWDDIKEHGQLSVVFYKEYDESTFRHAVDKENNGYVEKSYFLDCDAIADYELPFGVEPNDIFTDEDIMPDVTLTGDDLVRFLKTNYPKANLMQENKKKTIKLK